MSSTLMGREEQLAKPYPLWIERLLLLLAVIAFCFFHGEVMEATENTILGVIFGYILFPLALLASVELLGRGFQRWLSS